MEEFVRRAREGDLAAFDRLVERYQDAVCGVAFGIVGSFDDAQDIAQEAFLQAWRDLRDLADPARFPAWLYRIAANRSRDHLRRRRDDTRPDTPDLPSPDPGPADEVARAELRASVLQAMRGLSEPLRVTTALFYIDGYSLAEVADFLEIPEGTVKRRLHDARKRLREAMMDEMVSHALHDGKPGPELRARIAAELRARRDAFDDMASRTGHEDNTQWARWWIERRVADVRANAARYDIEADEDLPRMLPEYRQCETFRDDFTDLPRRWGIPADLDLVSMRDLCREVALAPLSLLRWEREGLPALRYHPWVLYDRPRVTAWIEATRPSPVQSVTAEDLRRPLLTVLRAVAEGLATAAEGVTLYETLETAHFFGPRDRVWAAEWDAAHEGELRQNAAQYALSRPADTWLGLPLEEDRGNVREIRDLSRRIGASPIEIVRWTREGMPCLRRSPLVRWDIRHVTAWLTERGILPERRTVKELDRLEVFACEAVATGDATPDEAHEALSGWVGVV